MQIAGRRYADADVLAHAERLEAVDVGELEELLTESWVLRAPARLVAAFEANKT